MGAASPLTRFRTNVICAFDPRMFRRVASIFTMYLPICKSSVAMMSNVLATGSLIKKSGSSIASPD